MKNGLFGNLFSDTRDGDFTDTERDAFIDERPGLGTLIVGIVSALKAVEPVAPLALDLYATMTAEGGEGPGVPTDLELAVDLVRLDPETPASPSDTLRATIHACNQKIHQSGFGGKLRVVFLR